MRKNKNMKYIHMLLLSAILGISCSEPKEQETPVVDESAIVYSISEITIEDSTPTVEIKKYTLIIDAQQNRTNDAKQIMNLKRRWPLAMQSQNLEEFEAILAKEFTFKGIGEFFNRTDYIKNRIKPDDWKITFVKYDNLCLQFINDLAILTYKNKITNENVKTKEIEIENITWTDIFLVEDEQWKIKSSHAIDYRME